MATLNLEELKVKLQDAKFYIGNQDILSSFREQLTSTEDGKLLDEWDKRLKEIKIQIATLLKTDNLAFLFGTGPSIPYGAVSTRSIPLELEYDLCNILINSKKIGDELKLFYKCLAFVIGEEVRSDKKILERHEELKTLCKEEQNINDVMKAQAEKGLKVNLEGFLDLLYRWFSAGLQISELTDDQVFANVDLLQKRTITISNEKGLTLEVNLSTLASLIIKLKSSFISLCRLPRKRGIVNDYAMHKDFVKKILTRPLNLQRTKLFTLNYDTLLEESMDRLGIFYLDGFIGKEHRYFRPESYGYDLYFPAGTTEGRVHRLDKVLHFYKLHGSITWVKKEEDFDNIYGLEMCSCDKEIAEKDAEKILIYPTPRKYGEVLGFPYSELLRSFASAIVQPQSVLFVLGYSFGDRHINNIIRQALTIPSFTVVIVDPCINTYVDSLIKLNDNRIYVFSGDTLGSFENFVKNAMPDLTEIKIKEKVVETYKAVGILDQGKEQKKE